MIAQIFILFSLVNAVLSARSLRQEPMVDVVPIDHKRATAAAHRLMKRTHTQLKADAAAVKKRTDAIMAKGKHDMEVAKGKRPMEAAGAKTIMSGTNQNIVSSGYYITRHRPNGDCSGIPTFVSGSKLSGCTNYGPGMGSSVTGCSHENDQGMVEEGYYNFYSDDCTGEPYYSSTYSSMYKCAYNMNYDYDTGASVPEMLGVQCSPSTTNVFKEGGLIYSQYDSYSNPTCQGNPDNFSVLKMGTCQLSVDYDNDYNMVNENTTFSYFSYVSCTEAGKLSVMAFSDPACTRPIYKGTVNMVKEFPNFNSCGVDPDYSYYTTMWQCVQPN